MLELISKQYDLSFEDIYMRLPSPDLVKRDEEFVETYPVARVLMGVADPASHVLTSYQVFLLPGWMIIRRNMISWLI